MSSLFKGRHSCLILLWSFLFVFCLSLIFISLVTYLSLATDHQYRLHSITYRLPTIKLDMNGATVVSLPSWLCLTISDEIEGFESLALRISQPPIAVQYIWLRWFWATTRKRGDTGPLNHEPNLMSHEISHESCVTRAYQELISWIQFLVISTYASEVARVWCNSFTIWDASYQHQSISLGHMSHCTMFRSKMSQKQATSYWIGLD